LVIDEMGYVALAEAGAEMLFQVIAGRAEKAAVIITTNRLCGELHKRFNAESSFMRTAGIHRPICNQVEGFSLRITGVAFSIAIN
jgi:DNA replication protein DnaC